MDIRYTGVRMSAEQAVAAIGTGWNLANTLECCGRLAEHAVAPQEFESAWGNPVTTPEMLLAVHDAGFGAVRLPVTWGPHMDSENRIAPEWLDRVAEVVGYVLDAGLFCLVNVHHDTGEHGWLRAAGEPGDAMRARFSAIWRQVAKRFAGYDDRLMFEGFNEILDSGSHWKKTDAASLERVCELNQLFVDTVRRAGGYNAGRNLAVCTYAAASHRHILRAFRLPVDPAGEGHIIVEVHSYDPWGFTVATADWARQTTRLTLEGRRIIAATFRRLDRCRTLRGVPVIIGEYASEDRGNTAERVRWARRLVGKAKARGICCFYWDTNEMRLLDREHCRFDFPEVLAAIMENAVGRN